MNANLTVQFTVEQQGAVAHKGAPADLQWASGSPVIYN